MKNVFFAVVFVLVGTFANANMKSETLSEINNLSEIELKLDLGDLTNKSNSQINDEIGGFINSNLNSVDEELQCKVTVTGSLSVGVSTVEIAVEVSGPCSEIRKSGTAIANMILDAVKRAVK